MTLDEIKDAVLCGVNIHWATHNYRVIRDSIGQWLIWSTCNDNYIGLTWRDGVTMNCNDPSEFFACDNPRCSYGPPMTRRNP